MARPIRYTLSSATSGAPIVLNNAGTSPFNVGIAVVLTSGASLTYTVEQTYDDVTSNSFNAATATWFPIENMSGETASAVSWLPAPTMAIRLRVSTYSSGSATITVQQSQQ